MVVSVCITDFNTKILHFAHTVRCEFHVMHTVNN